MWDTPSLRPISRRSSFAPLEVERRGPPGDLEPLDPGEEVEQFLGQPVGEIPVLSARGQVGEGQHRKGLWGCRGTPRRGPAVARRTRGDEIAKCGDQRRDDREIEHAARGYAGDAGRFGTRVALESMARELEGPGDGEHHREADYKQPNDDLEQPPGEAQGFRYDVGHLDQQPCHRSIKGRGPEDVASSEFGEKAHDDR